MFFIWLTEIEGYVSFGKKKLKKKNIESGLVELEELEAYHIC